MEEQRIGMMYLNLLKKSIAGLWDGMFPKGFRKSSAVPILLILLVVVGPIVAWRLHRLGQFGQLKREIKGEQVAAVPTGPRPGGVDPVVLTLAPTAGSTGPEFRTVTLLPGLGMGVLQITGSVPNLGEIELLANPTAKDIADGTTPNRKGVNDTWGALEAPWSGMLTGLLTPVGNSFRTSWRGKTLEAPSVLPGRGIGEGGLLNTLPADSSDALPAKNPTTAKASFKATDFGGRWASKNDIDVAITLNATTIDLEVTVKNVGEEPEPMGIGWHPRFVIPSGNREAAEIRLPGGELIEMGDTAKGTPSGKFGQPGMAISRFQQRSWPIGAEPVDGALVHLKPSAAESGVAAEVRDPQSGFGLRMTKVSGDIRELRVTSPTGSNYVSMGMQTDFDDPLGKEWGGAENVSITSLLPGQTAQWKIRLEIFAIPAHAAAGR